MIFKLGISLLVLGIMLAHLLNTIARDFTVTEILMEDYPKWYTNARVILGMEWVISSVLIIIGLFQWTFA